MSKSRTGGVRKHADGPKPSTVHYTVGDLPGILACVDRRPTGARSAKEATMAKMMSAKTEYLEKLPKVIPTNRVLVHNHVQPTRRIGSRGFRAWLESPGSRHVEVCDCGWAPELGRHYRRADGGAR